MAEACSKQGPTDRPGLIQMPQKHPGILARNEALSVNQILSAWTSHTIDKFMYISIFHESLPASGVERHIEESHQTVVFFIVGPEGIA